MEKITVRAENKDGVLLGTEVMEKAQTLAELSDLYSEKDIIAYAYRSIVIDKQRELRAAALAGQPSAAKKLAEANATVNAMIAEANKRKEAGDNALYDALVATHVIIETPAS